MKLMSFQPNVRRRQSELDRVFNTFFATPYISSSKKVSPQKTSLVNVKEADDAFILELAAPGWSKKDFKLEVHEDVLTISANRENVEKEGLTILRQEFKNTSIKRDFNLPETIDAKGIKALYKNGILTLTLPKKPEAKPLPPRQIEVA